MNDFSLEHDPLSGVEGLGEHTSTQTSLECPHTPSQGLKVLGANLYTNFPWVSPPLTPGFEGLGSIPLPKRPLSVPTPHSRVWRSWEHTSTLPKLPLSVPTPHLTSNRHSPSLGPGQGGYCSVFLDKEVCFTLPLLTTWVYRGTLI